MKLFISKDYFNNPKYPEVYLCNVSRKIIGELPVTDLQGTFKWNSYSEIQFTVRRIYIDVITGEEKVHPLFDKVECPRSIYIKKIGFFTIQDVDTSYGDKDEKQVSAFSLEYSTAGTKYLNNFRINTGEVDSKEVIYEQSKYGSDAKEENMYKLASYDGYDSNKSYFHRVYTDSRNYQYEQIKITDENEYKSHFGEDVRPEDILYVHGYANIKFYDPNTPELSLLHLIFAQIPEWKIDHVDYVLRNKERKFDEDRISVYDFIMNNVCDTFKCVCEWNTIDCTVSFYEEAEDGIEEDGEIQTRWNTDVFISRENLANEIKISYSSDDIKTKLKVSGADDVDIREVNFGRNYIMNLDYYHTVDWMGQDLYDAYQKYLNILDEYRPKYTEESQGRVEAYDKWNKLMNEVPVDNNTVLIGDTFEKLYCTYTPIDSAYLKDYTLTDSVDIGKYFDTLYLDKDCTNQIDKSLLHGNEEYVAQGYLFTYDSTKNQFRCRYYLNLALFPKKLTIYHVNKDLDANKADNILLRLKNNNSDVAVIRVYNAGTEDTPEYKVKIIVSRATSGIQDEPLIYTMREWMSGKITAEETGLQGFTVSYIGTMGAYFVISKGEYTFKDGKAVISKENLQNYGVKLLQEKQEIYMNIFQVQTEQMFSYEKYQCTASDDPPTGNIADGTRWFDTNSNPAKLYSWENNQWNEIDIQDDQEKYEDYQRYFDNYEKLQAVTEVLTEKEHDVGYCDSGYEVANRKINLNLYTKSNGILYYNGRTLEEDMKSVAEQYFSGYTIITQSMDYDVPLYTFKTSFDNKKNVFAVYLDNATPYVSYANSISVYKAKMNFISQKTDLDNNFNQDQLIALSPFIREDEFNDDNFLLNGYESEKERIEIYQDLMDTASKELKTLSQPSLEFSMTMYNLFALPEFEPLINQFQLGNFVMVHIRDGYVKRARLLEVDLNFDDLSDFNCSFGNLVTTKSEIDKHADLLEQAITAGKQVATSSGNWQRAVDVSNKLEESISNGLSDATLEVGKASGQNVVWGPFGIWGRKIDQETGEIDPEQFRIINNKLVFSNDGFKTSKAIFGKYKINGEIRWGPLAEYITADTIEGKVIKGGKIIIGEEGGSQFIVSEDGSVQITDSSGGNKYALQSTVETIENVRKYRIDLTYDNPTLFSSIGSECIITCTVYNWEEDITQKLINNNVVFAWRRISNSADDDAWNNSHMWSTTHNGLQSNQIKITNDDIPKNAQIECYVQFDDQIL